MTIHLTDGAGMSFNCSIYGLGLRLNRPIAGLAGLKLADRIDVDLYLGSEPPELSGIPAEAWRPFFVHDERDEQESPILVAESVLGFDYVRISYADGTRLYLDGKGARLWATWPESATLEDTATYLLGPGLGYLLRLRGVTCLHASAIEVDGRAVALVGPSGAGKSSTAAAFARLGYPVLSDDIVALSEQDGCFSVQPAYPRIRLWPESVESLFGSEDSLPRITPTWDKRFLDLGSDGYRFQSEPLPLAAIYFLGERSDEPQAPLVEAIGARNALMALVSDTYGKNLVGPVHRAREFEALGRLVARVPLRKVRPRDDMTRIFDLCKVISDDFQRSVHVQP